MAWIYKRGEVWWIGYRVNGKQFLKSTGTSDRAEADRELRKVETLFAVKDSSSVLADVYAALSGKTAPKITLAAALGDWLAECSGSTGKTTFAKYKQIAGELKEHFHATEAGPLLVDIGTDGVRDFLVQKRKCLSAATVNLCRKIVSAFFLRAIKNGQTRENPVLAIKPFKPGQDEEQARRPFTMAELKLIFEKAPDAFWRYAITAGFFTGQRLGDLVCLRWGSVDLEHGVIRLTTRKTQSKLQVPMAPQLRAMLSGLQAKLAKPPAPTDFLWPEQAEQYLKNGPQWFSRGFYDIMTKAGLTVARPETHEGLKNGRSSKRDTSAVSFHSLRHSFVSMLKATGGNQAVAKELAGHSSDLISDNYTHLPADVLATAINQLPTIEAK